MFSKIPFTYKPSTKPNNKKHSNDEFIANIKRTLCDNLLFDSEKTCEKDKPKKPSPNGRDIKTKKLKHSVSFSADVEHFDDSLNEKALSDDSKRKDNEYNKKFTKIKEKSIEEIDNTEKKAVKANKTPVRKDLRVKKSLNVFTDPKVCAKTHSNENRRQKVKNCSDKRNLLDFTCEETSTMKIVPEQSVDNCNNKNQLLESKQVDKNTKILIQSDEKLNQFKFSELVFPSQNDFKSDNKRIKDKEIENKSIRDVKITNNTEERILLTNQPEQVDKKDIPERKHENSQYETTQMNPTKQDMSILKDIDQKVTDETQKPSPISKGFLSHDYSQNIGFVPQNSTNICNLQTQITTFLSSHSALEHETKILREILQKRQTELELSQNNEKMLQKEVNDLKKKVKHREYKHKNNENVDSFLLIQTDLSSKILNLQNEITSKLEIHHKDAIDQSNSTNFKLKDAIETEFLKLSDLLHNKIEPKLIQNLQSIKEESNENFKELLSDFQDLKKQFQSKSDQKHLQHIKSKLKPMIKEIIIAFVSIQTQIFRILSDKKEKTNNLLCEKDQQITNLQTKLSKEEHRHTDLIKAAIDESESAIQQSEIVVRSWNEKYSRLNKKYKKIKRKLKKKEKIDEISSDSCSGWSQFNF